MYIWLVLCFLAGASSVPLPNVTDSQELPAGLSPQDYDFIKLLPTPRASTFPGFSYLYVNHQGNIYTSAGSPGTTVQVAGSPGTTYDARYYAAAVVGSMVKNMPTSIFTKLATTASVGVFSKREKLTVYPEYAYLANTAACGSSCSGSCDVTCTFDGRKYEDITGVGGRRGVVLDDNVVCNARDPFRGKHNTLAHEFTHTIHEYALPYSTKQQVTNAYRAAKQKTTWVLSSYAMSDEREYLAEGSTVFFGVNEDRQSNTGGMNMCGSSVCHGEMAGRARLRQHDPALYNILKYVFTNNRPNLPSGLKVCPQSYPSSIVG